jgi:amylosucrase
VAPALSPRTFPPEIAVHGNSPAIVVDLPTMYQHELHQQINQCLKEKDFPDNDAGILFPTRFIANGAAIKALYDEIYGSHPKARESFASLLTIITRAFIERPESMKDKDDEKLDQGHWFLSNNITGMSLYVDRFAGRLKEVESRLDYLRRLGVNLLHACRSSRALPERATVVMPYPTNAA